MDLSRFKIAGTYRPTRNYILPNGATTMSDETTPAVNPVGDVIGSLEQSAETALDKVATALNAKIGGDAAAEGELKATFEHGARYAAAVVGPLVAKGVNYLLGKLLGAGTPAAK